MQPKIGLPPSSTPAAPVSTAPEADPVRGYPGPVRTVADWLAAAAQGDELLGWLDQARAAAQRSAGPQLGVWIHLCPEAQWAAQVAHLRERLASTADRASLLRRYPLLGLPFAVKDNIDIAQAPTTAACPAFSHVAPRSASVVQRLLDAGALWLGKTNLDQFATGLVGTRSPYGQPACVDDPTRISGGSSSGSAVAVAHGIVPFALGTDTAGSGRVPAAFNGLVGLKPTPGRVSTEGVLPACRTLDCVSIFAHRVADAAHVLALIEGPDGADSYSRFEPGRASLPPRLRIGVPRRPELDAAIGYDQAWAQACLQAQAMGHELVELDFAGLDAVAALLYDGPWVAERHAACRELFEREPQAMDSTVRQVIGRALAYSATDAFEGQYRLRSLQAEAQAWWQQIDLLLVPSAPGHPRFAEIAADPVGANARLGQFTNFVNLLGWCALALPADRTAQGLPFGVTLIARGGDDAALARFGLRWEQQAADPAPGTLAPPWLSPAVEPALPLAVVGAHLAGLPLNGQLLERGATLLEATTTAPAYRLFALPGTTPPKPGLMRSASGGAAVAVEVWSMPMSQLGSFLALIPAPLGLGSLELADGRWVHGFLCEAHALQDAREITPLGGWRAFLAASTAAQ
jgi:allophanate hydrolase